MGVKRSFLKGLAYVALAKYSGILISIIITAILARVLTPEDYGVVALATVFIVFFTMIGDMGLGPAIVQFRNLTKEDISSVFGFSFWIAVGLATIFFSCAGFIADFYNRDDLVLICQILSLQVFFSVLNIVPNGLLAKEKRFDIIAYRNVIIQILTGIVAIISAYNGLGVYSLLISPIGTSILVFVVNEIFMKVRIKFIPEKKPLKIIFNFSFYQFLFGFVNYFNRNMDKFIVGKYISVEQLGYYEKSYRLMQLPIQNINGVMAPVLHPYLADYQNDTNKLADLFYRMTSILANISVIVAAFLFISSRELILIVYGDNWEPAILCFQILSISVISQVSSVTVGSFIQVYNKTRILFYVGCVNTFVFIASLIISLYTFGTTPAICATFVLVFIFEAMSSYFALSRFCLQRPLSKVLKQFIVPLVYFFVVLLVYFAFHTSLDELNKYISISIKGLLWLSMSSFYLQFFTDYKPIQMIKKYLKNKRT